MSNLRNGAFAEDSWSIQRRSGEDDRSSNGLGFQGEGSSQRQRVRSRRRQSRLQVPYLVMVSSNFNTHVLDFSFMPKAASFIDSEVLGFWYDLWIKIYFLFLI